MTLKTTITALILGLAPAASFAFCSERNHQAQSCAQGTVWDAEAQQCIKQVTG